MKSSLVSALTLLGVCLTVAPAGATVFTFNDEYYLAASTRPTQTIAQNAVTVFGTSNGVGSAGSYQGNNGAHSTLIMNVGGSNGSIAGEYALNNGAFTNQELALFGWGQSLGVGQQVGNVYNTANPHDGSVLYFQYKVAGTTTPFTFNGFDLHTYGAGTATRFMLEGLDAANHVLDSAILTVVGNATQSYTTETLNWTGVTTVAIVSGNNASGAPVADWDDNTLSMDNVVINAPVPRVPEPVSIAVLATGLIGLAIARLERARRLSPAALKLK